MSLLDDALALFSYTSIDDITVNNLKKALKKALLSAHPDKNDGNDTDIDRILQSYVYLYHGEVTLCVAVTKNLKRQLVR
jgi:hypothetical protein